MDEDNNRDASQAKANDAMDRILDAVLARYAAVEPRPGLEGRILANLRTPPESSSARAWWTLGLTAAVAAVIVIAIALGFGFKRHAQPLVERQTPLSSPRDTVQQVQTAKSDGVAVQPPHRNADVRTARNRPPSGWALAKIPKRDQFPSPQPLSEQEKLLASYISKYPVHAALLAELRTEALSRDAEERRQLAAEGRDPQ